MASTRQRPNLLGIHKEMLEAGKDTRAESLVGGAMKAFAVNILEQEKAEAEMDQHMEALGGIQNISKLSEEQKRPVTEFLRKNRDEYADLAKQYSKSKDPAIKDKMDAIKYRFENLNTQLSTFATNKAEYMHDYEEGDLMKSGTFAKDNLFYTSVYGNPNAQFTIDPDSGGMSFTANGETRKLEDFGGHTLRNYDGEKNIDTLFGLAAQLKTEGKDMNKDRFATNFVNGHKDVSKNDLAALLQTDLTGDDSDLSFMDQWETGTMGDEFYSGFTKDEATGNYIITKDDVNSLLKDKQRGLDLMGKFVGNVSQGIYDEGKVSSDILQTRQYKQAQIDAMRKKSEKEEETGDFTEKVKIDGLPNTYVGPKERNKRRKRVENSENFSGAYGDYVWDAEKGGYILNKDEDNVKSKWEVMNDEKIDKKSDNSGDFGLNPASIKNTAYSTTGEVVVGGITAKDATGNDNTVKANLNNLLPINNPKNYSFDQMPDNLFGIEVGWESPWRNAVVLRDGDGNVMTYNDETPIVILTSGGGGKTNSKNDIDASVKRFNDWIDAQDDFALETGQVGQTTQTSEGEPEDVD
jgi:hypothetical protein